MTTSLLEHVTSLLNTFPSNDGISKTLSPSTIVIGRPNLDMNQPLIEFGAYAAVHNGTTNTMKGRITPAIALNRSNDKGGYFFMSLETGKRIHGFIWTIKPIKESNKWVLHVYSDSDFAGDKEKRIRHGHTDKFALCMIVGE